MGCNIPRPTKRPKTPEINSSKPVLYKCENCGANLVQSGSSWHCEYCGTKYGIDLGQKEVTASTLYSDGKAVYTAYQEFGKVAHDLDVPKLPIKLQR